MIEPTYFYKCQGFEPVRATNSHTAALAFAKARALELCGADARVQQINLEEFSADGRIERYTAELCSEGGSKRVWLCVTRLGRIREEPH